jgi:type I restriction enzyme M protein
MSGAQEGGEFFTPPSLVNTIVKIIQPNHGIVADLAVGSAGMFVQTAHFIEDEGADASQKVTFYGQEKADTNTRLAKMNMAVHGLEGSIMQGNTFYEDKHELLGKCDFIMANPPFNVDGIDKSKDSVKKDPRLPFGLPKNDNGNYLWIQYFYSCLNENGRAGFVMASSASDAGHSEKDLRQKLIPHVHKIRLVQRNQTCQNFFLNSLSLLILEAPCLYLLPAGLTQLSKIQE